MGTLEDRNYFLEVGLPRILCKGLRFRATRYSKRGRRLFVGLGEVSLGVAGFQVLTLVGFMDFVAGSL